MSDEIRKIALEFFKDKFSSIYNKQKELIEKIEALEKKVKTLDLEKKLKIDYMMKMNQLEKNDKSHQALHDKAFKEIAELRLKVSQKVDILVSSNLMSKLKEELNELKKRFEAFKEGEDDDIKEIGILREETSALEKKVNEINSGCGRFEMDYVKQIAELKSEFENHNHVGIKEINELKEIIDMVNNRIKLFVGDEKLDSKDLIIRTVEGDI